jgi:hypothetical protein
MIDGRKSDMIMTYAHLDSNRENNIEHLLSTQFNSKQVIAITTRRRKNAK